jgi:hypothetical protein
MPYRHPPPQRNLAVRSGKFARAHVANLLGCLPATLFACAISPRGFEPKSGLSLEIAKHLYDLGG